MQKIGHITVWKLSYGSPLQALATQYIFKKYNMECELIRYEYDYGSESIIHKIIRNIRESQNIFQKATSYYKGHSNHFISNGRKERERSFEKFVNQYINFTEKISTPEERLSKIKGYKIMLSGSDQLWNPVNLKEGYFNCRIVPDGIKLLSYASSFGTAVIPENQRDETAYALSRFNKISMRESSGAEIVHQLIGKDVPVVLDPTWLLTTDEWLRFCPKENKVEGDYILGYFLSGHANMREEVKKLSRETGMKIVSLPHMLGYMEADVDFADEEIYACEPGEWINLIRNASYVCTDSFHGTVFSILFQKKFLTMCAYSDTDKRSTNTRIYEILNKLNLLDRLCNANDDIAKIQNDIDYGKSMELLNKYRMESFDYIEHILE